MLKRYQNAVVQNIGLCVCYGAVLGGGGVAFGFIPNPDHFSFKY